MVQYHDFMQVIEVEREARHRLPAVLASLFDLPDEQVGVEGSDGVDLELHAGRRHWVAEVKASSSPGAVAAAAEQLRSVVAGPGQVMPLLVVPYMTPAGARAAAAKGLDWIDLSGNARIRTDDLYVWVEGRPNQFRQRGRPATPFAPKSARIARVLLLDPQRWWRQKELAEETELDDGHLSRVIRRLDDDDLLEHRSAEFRPRDPEVLLDAWEDAYRFDRHDIVAAHVSGSGSELAGEVHERLEAAGVPHAFTGLSAAWALDHHARYRLASVYVEGDPRSVLESTGIRREERGANVQLIGPDDVGVFAGMRSVDGLPCVSPPQVYLDLRHLPERAREAADELRSAGRLWNHG